MILSVQQDLAEVSGLLYVADKIPQERTHTLTQLKILVFGSEMVIPRYDHNKFQILFVSILLFFKRSLSRLKLFEREGIASPDVEQRINRLIHSYLSLKNNEVLSLVGVF